MESNLTNIMAGKKVETPDLVISAVLAVIGLFYVLLPHASHISLGIGFGLDHTVHVVLGIVLLAAGAGYYATKAGLLKK